MESFSGLSPAHRTAFTIQGTVVSNSVAEPLSGLLLMLQYCKSIGAGKSMAFFQCAHTTSLDDGIYTCGSNACR